MTNFHAFALGVMVALTPSVALSPPTVFGVNFSVYTDFKNGNRDFLLQNGAVSHATEVLSELLEYAQVLEKTMDRKLRWHLAVSWR